MSQPIASFGTAAPSTIFPSCCSSASLKDGQARQHRCREFGVRRVCLNPDTKVGDPNLAVDVVYLMMVEDVFESEKTPRNGASSVREDGRDIFPAAFGQRKRAVKWEGKDTPVRWNEGVDDVCGRDVFTWRGWRVQRSECRCQ